MRGERSGGAGLLARVLGALALIIVSLVLAIGLSWSSVSRRLTGQMDTDEVG